MTIKTRNRFNLVLTVLAIVISGLQLLFLLYQLIFKKFTLPEVYIPGSSSLFLFSYNPVFTIIGIILLDIFIIITSIMINITFEKTQSTEIVFFILFLFACLCDSLRLLVPLLKVAQTYSRLLMQIAYVTLFARILAPLSLLGITILSDDESRHTVNKNCVFILITSLFFAKLIPFNTAIVLPNFCISYGYRTTLQYSSIFICIAGISTLFFNNRRNEYKQYTTIGFAILAVGYSVMFSCKSLFNLIIGSIFLIGGTALYLKKLHTLYLWQN